MSGPGASAPTSHAELVAVRNQDSLSQGGEAERLRGRAWSCWALVYPSRARLRKTRVYPRPGCGCMSLLRTCSESFTMANIEMPAERAGGEGPEAGAPGRCASAAGRVCAARGRRRAAAERGRGRAGDEDGGEVFEGPVALPVEEDAREHDRDGLAGLGEDLGGVAARGGGARVGE